MALTKVRGSGIDADGQEIILDADTDTTITADTDDQVDIKVGGADKAVFLANNMHLIGGTVARIQLSSSGSGTTPNTGNNNVHLEGNDDTLVLNAAGNGHIIFQEEGSERMRIHTGGNVSVGVNSITSGGFSGNTRMVIQSAASGGETLGIRSTSSSGTGLELVVFRDGDNNQIGTIVGNASANTTSYGTSSDYRLKENVVNVDKSIDKLKKLKPKTFNMISDPDNKLDGFLAHELAEVIPNATHGVKDAVNEDGSIKPQQVDYGLITPLLTAALQEAVAKIETLEAKVTALESK